MNALPVQKIDLVKGPTRLIKKQNEPQAIGQIALAGEFTRGSGMDDTPAPRTKPKHANGASHNRK
jgi:hypothetical protein